MNIKLKFRIVKKFGLQADFAVAVKEHESLISRVIRCRRELSEDKKILWAKALDCTVNEIFERN
ncbi:MAG: helix-turn-helix transcriptional regulator [Desulfobacterales bacterium]|nr:helix-turn-helix transcriptional regulator [Desulfobacterales bacterium]